MTPKPCIFEEHETRNMRLHESESLSGSVIKYVLKKNLLYEHLKVPYDPLFHIFIFQFGHQRSSLIWLIIH